MADDRDVDRGDSAHGRHRDQGQAGQRRTDDRPAEVAAVANGLPEDPQGEHVRDEDAGDPISGITPHHETHGQDGQQCDQSDQRDGGGDRGGKPEKQHSEPGGRCSQDQPSHQPGCAVRRQSRGLVHRLLGDGPPS